MPKTNMFYNFLVCDMCYGIKNKWSGVRRIKNTKGEKEEVVVVSRMLGMNSWRYHLTTKNNNKKEGEDIEGEVVPGREVSQYSPSKKENNL